MSGRHCFQILDQVGSELLCKSSYLSAQSLFISIVLMHNVTVVNTCNTTDYRSSTHACQIAASPLLHLLDMYGSILHYEHCMKIKRIRLTCILCRAFIHISGAVLELHLSIPNHFQRCVLYNHIPYMKFSCFSFLIINEAAKEENNQCHQGYDTRNSYTNDSSSINRSGGFTCNN